MMMLATLPRPAADQEIKGLDPADEQTLRDLIARYFENGESYMPADEAALDVVLVRAGLTRIDLKPLITVVRQRISSHQALLDIRDRENDFAAEERRRVELTTERDKLLAETNERLAKLNQEIAGLVSGRRGAIAAIEDDRRDAFDLLKKTNAAGMPLDWRNFAIRRYVSRDPMDVVPATEFEASLTPSDPYIGKRFG